MMAFLLVHFIHSMNEHVLDINYNEVMCLSATIWYFCPKNAVYFNFPNTNRIERSFPPFVSEKIKVL